MEIEIISTNSAPKAIGPYSQAVVSSGIIYCSGQIPINPDTGYLVLGGIEAQTTQVIDNLEGILAECCANLSNILKVTVYMKDLADFSSMNRIYKSMFGESMPARSTVEVSALPLGAAIKIECIAINTNKEYQI